MNIGVDEDGIFVYLGVEYKFVSWVCVYVEYGYGDGIILGYINKGFDVEVKVMKVDSVNNFGIGVCIYW